MTGTIENLPLRGMFAKWRGRRSRKRQQRSLDCLRQMDPHTLSDIGLNVLLEDANVPESRTRNAVITTIRKIAGRAGAGES